MIKRRRTILKIEEYQYRFIRELPSDILYLILQHLTPNDVWQFACCSKYTQYHVDVYLTKKMKMLTFSNTMDEKDVFKILKKMLRLPGELLLQQVDIAGAPVESSLLLLSLLRKCSKLDSLELPFHSARLIRCASSLKYLALHDKYQDGDDALPYEFDYSYLCHLPTLETLRFRNHFLNRSRLQYLLGTLVKLPSLHTLEIGLDDPLYADLAAKMFSLPIKNLTLHVRDGSELFGVDIDNEHTIESPYLETLTICNANIASCTFMPRIRLLKVKQFSVVGSTWFDEWDAFYDFFTMCPNMEQFIAPDGMVIGDPWIALDEDILKPVLLGCSKSVKLFNIGRIEVSCGRHNCGCSRLLSFSSSFIDLAKARIPNLNQLILPKQFLEGTEL